MHGNLTGLLRKRLVHGLLKMKDDVQGEFSLHHDFNPSTATTIVKMVQDVEEYLLKVCGPLQDKVVLKNILTKEIVINVTVDKCSTVSRKAI